ncbi:PadR family transcriptional regulator [candidate division KSB1 bacterium]
MKDLTLTEEMFLLAVWKLKDNAYGVTIRKHVSESTQRIYPYGTLYSALDKLVEKGYLTRTASDPTPERGGRSKNYYHITEAGAEALQAAFELKQSMWGDISGLKLEKS